MKFSVAQRFLPCSFIALFFYALQPGAKADPVPVRHVGGTIRGLLELRGEDGRVIASGDITRVVRGDRITSRIVFHFKDGSIDDETTVFSQRRQSAAEPSDMTIGSEAVTFAREQGPLYPEGPMITIKLASPTWPLH